MNTDTIDVTLRKIREQVSEVEDDNLSRAMLNAIYDLEQEISTVKSYPLDLNEITEDLFKKKEFNEYILEERRRVEHLWDSKQLLNQTLEEELKTLLEKSDLVKSELEDSLLKKWELDMVNQDLSNQFSMLKREYKTVEKEVKQAVGLQEKKVDDMKKSLLAREMKYRILLLLLKERYLSHPAYDVLLTLLRNPSIRDTRRLSQVANVSVRVIHLIFEDLRENGIMSFDINKTTDNFHLLVKLEIDV